MSKNKKLITTIVPLVIFIVAAGVAIEVCETRRSEALSRFTDYDGQREMNVRVQIQGGEDLFTERHQITQNTITTGDAAISYRLDDVVGKLRGIRTVAVSIEWMLYAWFSIWCVQQIILYIRPQLSSKVRQ
jgi:hypothetical protein